MVMRNGMKQAAYFVYSEAENPHHFALNFDYYTHFTSPIRRYPDVMVHRVLKALLCGESEGFQTNEVAVGQVERCNEKKTATRRATEQLDRAVFCIFLRSRKEWFYTIGTVLSFQPSGNERDPDQVTIYCSQLGRESKVRLCAEAEIESMELYMGEVQDELLLPETWRFEGKGSLMLEWLPKSGNGCATVTKLKMISCVPIVIIPTET